MARKSIARYHWLNTFVGVLDSAFWLSDAEQMQVTGILNRLLSELRIPERGEPAMVSTALALEVESGFYTIALAGPRDSLVPRPVRMVSPNDTVVSVETWRDSLLSMITVAYPDLDPAERLVSAKVFDDLLMALGVPYRAASAVPDQVIRSFRESPDSMVQ